MLRNYCVVYGREGGLSRLWLLQLVEAGGGASSQLCLEALAMEEEVCTVYPTDNREWDSDVLRFSYSSFTTPTVR
jgi:protease II